MWPSACLAYAQPWVPYLELEKKIKVVDEFSGEISSGSMHGINGDQNRSSSVVDPTHT